jgi:transposase-like protein
MRKTKKHKTYTIDEKNEIVREYLNGITGSSELIRKYDIASFSVLHRWITQYQKYGSAQDNRGKSSKRKGNYTRKKKLVPEQMSREELIEYVKAVEDIKKLMVFLKHQKKNIK